MLRIENIFNFALRKLRFELLITAMIDVFDFLSDCRTNTRSPETGILGSCLKEYISRIANLIFGKTAEVFTKFISAALFKNFCRTFRLPTTNIRGHQSFYLLSISIASSSVTASTSSSQTSSL